MKITAAFNKIECRVPRSYFVLLSLIFLYPVNWCIGYISFDVSDSVTLHAKFSNKDQTEHYQMYRLTSYRQNCEKKKHWSLTAACEYYWHQKYHCRCMSSDCKQTSARAFTPCPLYFWCKLSLTNTKMYFSLRLTELRFLQLGLKVICRVLIWVLRSVLYSYRESPSLEK